MNRFFITILAIATTFFTTQSLANHHEKNGACKEDIAKYCSNIEAGEGRIHRCLNENKAKLTPQCKAKTAKTRHFVKKAHKVCAEDTKKFCSEVKLGERRLIECLKPHESELSEACKNKVNKAKSRVHKKHPSEKEE